MKLMTLSLNNNWKFYALLLIVLLLFSLRFCNPRPVKVIVPEITKETKQRDSIITVVKYKDSIRTKLIVKWRNKTDTLRFDTTYVHEIVSICDTIIKADSSEIVSLKKVHSLDSVIIGKQSEALTKDSIQIVKLNRRVRFWRGLNKFSFITGAALGGYVGTKLP